MRNSCAAEAFVSMVGGSRALVLPLTLAMVVGVAVARGDGGVHGAAQAAEGAVLRWQDVTPFQSLGNGGARYFSFAMPNGSRAHVVVVDLKAKDVALKVRQAARTAPTSNLAREGKALAAVNAGFFNLSDGVSASYTVIDAKQVADPSTNKALIQNPKLIPHLAQIFGRSEVRFLIDNKGNHDVVIVPHATPLGAGKRLVQSIQAGPQLLPVLTAREEAFLRTGPDGKEADSIGVRKAAARTAFGITSDGHGMLVCVAGKGQDPESSGVTLAELAEVMAGLGCKSAINFDGGASSTMFVAAGQKSAENVDGGRVVCGKSPETSVKSVLLLLPAAAKR